MHHVGDRALTTLPEKCCWPPVFYHFQMNISVFQNSLLEGLCVISFGWSLPRLSVWDTIPSLQTHTLWVLSSALTERHLWFSQRRIMWPETPILTCSGIGVKEKEVTREWPLGRSHPPPPGEQIPHDATVQGLLNLHSPRLGTCWWRLHVQKEQAQFTSPHHASGKEAMFIDRVAWAGHLLLEFLPGQCCEKHMIVMPSLNK